MANLQERRNKDGKLISYSIRGRQTAQALHRYLRGQADLE